MALTVTHEKVAMAYAVTCQCSSACTSCRSALFGQIQCLDVCGTWSRFRHLMPPSSRAKAAVGIIMCYPRFTAILDRMLHSAKFSMIVLSACLSRKAKFAVRLNLMHNSVLHNT
eukprot:6179550-Pleurochrysis_carterae.AAC.2